MPKESDELHIQIEKAIGNNTASGDYITKLTAARKLSRLLQQIKIKKQEIETIQGDIKQQLAELFEATKVDAKYYELSLIFKKSENKDLFKIINGPWMRERVSFEVIDSGSVGGDVKHNIHAHLEEAELNDAVNNIIEEYLKKSDDDLDKQFSNRIEKLDQKQKNLAVIAHLATKWQASYNETEEDRKPTLSSKGDKTIISDIEYKLLQNISIINAGEQGTDKEKKISILRCPYENFSIKTGGTESVLMNDSEIKGSIKKSLQKKLDAFIASGIEGKLLLSPPNDYFSAVPREAGDATINQLFANALEEVLKDEKYNEYSNKIIVNNYGDPFCVGGAVGGKIKLPNGVETTPSDFDIRNPKTYPEDLTVIDNMAAHYFGENENGKITRYAAQGGVGDGKQKKSFEELLGVAIHRPKKGKYKVTCRHSGTEPCKEIGFLTGKSEHFALKYTEMKRQHSKQNLKQQLCDSLELSEEDKKNFDELLEDLLKSTEAREIIENIKQNFGFQSDDAAILLLLSLMFIASLGWGSIVFTTLAMFVSAFSSETNKTTQPGKVFTDKDAEGFVRELDPNKLESFKQLIEKKTLSENNGAKKNILTKIEKAIPQQAAAAAPAVPTAVAAARSAEDGAAAPAPAPGGGEERCEEIPNELGPNKINELKILISRPLVSSATAVTGAGAGGAIAQATEATTGVATRPRSLMAVGGLVAVLVGVGVGWLVVAKAKAEERAGDAEKKAGEKAEEAKEATNAAKDAQEQAQVAQAATQVAQAQAAANAEAAAKAKAEAQAAQAQAQAANREKDAAKEKAEKKEEEANAARDEANREKDAANKEKEKAEDARDEAAKAKAEAQAANKEKEKAEAQAQAANREKDAAKEKAEKKEEEANAARDEAEGKVETLTKELNESRQEQVKEADQLATMEKEQHVDKYTGCEEFDEHLQTVFSGQEVKTLSFCDSSNEPHSGLVIFVKDKEGDFHNCGFVYRDYKNDNDITYRAFISKLWTTEKSDGPNKNLYTAFDIVHKKGALDSIKQYSVNHPSPSDNNTTPPTDPEPPFIKDSSGNLIEGDYLLDDQSGRAFNNETTDIDDKTESSIYQFANSLEGSIRFFDGSDKEIGHFSLNPFFTKTECNESKFTHGMLKIEFEKDKISGIADLSDSNINFTSNLNQNQNQSPDAIIARRLQDDTTHTDHAESAAGVANTHTDHAESAACVATHIASFDAVAGVANTHTDHAESVAGVANTHIASFDVADGINGALRVISWLSPMFLNQLENAERKEFVHKLFVGSSSGFAAGLVHARDHNGSDIIEAFIGLFVATGFSMIGEGIATSEPSMKVVAKIMEYLGIPYDPEYEDYYKENIKDIATAVTTTATFKYLLLHGNPVTCAAGIVSSGALIVAETMTKNKRDELLQKSALDGSDIENLKSLQEQLFKIRKEKLCLDNALITLANPASAISSMAAASASLYAINKNQESLLKEIEELINYDDIKTRIKKYDETYSDIATANSLATSVGSAVGSVVLGGAVTAGAASIVATGAGAVSAGAGACAGAVAGHGALGAVAATGAGAVSANAAAVASSAAGIAAVASATGHGVLGAVAGAGLVGGIITFGAAVAGAVVVIGGAAFIGYGFRRASDAYSESGNNENPTEVANPVSKFFSNFSNLGPGISAACASYQETGSELYRDWCRPSEDAHEAKSTQVEQQLKTVSL